MPHARDRDISVFLLGKAMRGVTVGRNQSMMGLRGGSHVELSFDAVKLGPEHLLGAAGRGLRLILGTIGRVRLFGIGASAVGTATLLFGDDDPARAGPQAIRISGRGLQMIQSQLADSAIEIAAARLPLP